MNPAVSAPTGTPPRGAAPPRRARRIGKQSRKGTDTAGDRFVWTLGLPARLELTLTWVGVMLFMMVIITYQFRIGDLAVGMALLGMLTDRKGVIFPRALLLIFAFTIWCWLGTYTTRFAYPSQEATIALAKLGLVWWAALAAIRTRAQFRWAMLAMVFMYSAYPIRGGIMNILIYKSNTFGRVAWNYIFANANDYAGITMLFLSIAAGLVVTERHKLYRLGAIACCVVFPIMVLYTQSRANFIALGFFGLAVFTGQKKKARSFGMFAILVAVAAFTVPAQAWERLGGVTSLGSGEEAIRDLDTSANERIEIWRVATKVVKDNLATGVGWGTYEYANHETIVANRDLFPYFIDKRTVRDAHSTYLTVLAETGAIGFFLWLGAIGSVLFYAEKRRRRFKSVLPQAAQQLLFLEYGLGAYGIAAIWGSYAAHSFLYIHLTWIWVAAALLEKDAIAFGKTMRIQRRGAPSAQPGAQRVSRQRQPIDPRAVGYPVASHSSSDT